MFFYFMLANIGFPPTQFYLRTFSLNGLVEVNIFIAFLSLISIFIFSGVSGFWIFTRVFFGNFASTQGYYY